MSKHSDFIWMRVSADDLELPEIVADSAAELAELCGVTINAIYSGTSRTSRGIIKNGIYRKVRTR